MPDDAVRVTYIPESVRKQIRDDIKREVMAKVKDEGWAVPRQLPEWVSRYKVGGDIKRILIVHQSSKLGGKVY